MPTSSGHITLSCLSCGGTWTQARRRGQYPLRCTPCRITPRLSARQVAQRLAGYARRRRVDAVARGHGRYGWSVWASTPWHDRPVILRDSIDVDYLAAELRS